MIEGQKSKVGVRSPVHSSSILSDLEKRFHSLLTDVLTTIERAARAKGIQNIDKIKERVTAYLRLKRRIPKA